MTVIEGTAVVLAPLEKVSRPRPRAPEVRLQEHRDRLHELFGRGTLFSGADPDE